MAEPERIALVTGASAGIGLYTALGLARAGFCVVMAGRDGARLERARRMVVERSGGARVETTLADFASLATVRGLAERVLATHDRLDLLVNNAGLGAAGRFDRCDPSRIGEILQVNIVALTELTRLLLPGMIARGHGRVMLVASVAGFQPGPHMAAYFASKTYVLSLGEALAYELRATGVSVTTLCPGATATRFFTVAGADNSAMARRLRRMMRAEDVARLGYRGLAAGPWF